MCGLSRFAGAGSADAGDFRVSSETQREANLFEGEGASRGAMMATLKSRSRAAPDSARLLIGINLSMVGCVCAPFMLTTTNHSQDQHFKAWAF